MSIQFRLELNNIVIFGATYKHKEEIKLMGARYSPKEKSWVLAYSKRSHEIVGDFCKRVNSKDFTKNLNTEVSADKNETANNHTGYSIVDIINLSEKAVLRSFPKPIWVLGEVQNIHRTQRAVYLEIAEKDPQSKKLISIGAVIWASSNSTQMSTFKSLASNDSIIQEGFKIRCLCKINLYKNKGQISLNILEIDPQYTKGALAFARDQFFKKLKTEKLDIKNKRLYCSSVPLRIGLISASKSRAESDFLHQLQVNKFPGTVIYVTASMQGKNAKTEVPIAIKSLCKSKCDLIVLTRGGGSVSDLSCFDSPEIVYAIANSSIPIIAAIGHHDDYCLAEEVAFLKIKTPTAAADCIGEILFKAVEKITDYQSKLTDSLNKLLEKTEKKINNKINEIENFSKEWYKPASHKLELLSLEMRKKYEEKLQYKKSEYETKKILLEEKTGNIINNISTKINFLEKRLSSEVDNKIKLNDSHVMNLESKIDNRDPYPLMNLGWIKIYKDDNCITSIKDCKNGDILKARLVDGNLSLKILEINTIKNMEGHNDN